MDELEIDPNVSLASDMLLDLIGEVVKLGVLLAELSDDNLNLVVDRYNAFVSAVESLPIEPPDPSNWNNETGEA